MNREEVVAFVPMRTDFPSCKGHPWLWIDEFYFKQVRGEKYKIKPVRSNLALSDAKSNTWGRAPAMEEIAVRGFPSKNVLALPNSFQKFRSKMTAKFVVGGLWSYWWSLCWVDYLGILILSCALSEEKGLGKRRNQRPGGKKWRKGGWIFINISKYNVKYS